MFRNFVVLTDPEIKNTLLQNGEALQTFPFLLAARQKLQDFKTCPSCRETEASRQLASALKEVRRQIATMPNDAKERLRKIINCNKFRVFYYKTASSGATVREFVDYPATK